MYTVALVQNQSEMSHYACADARSLLRDCGYDGRLFTGDDIADLPSAMNRRAGARRGSGLKCPQ